MNDMLQSLSVLFLPLNHYGFVSQFCACVCSPYIIGTMGETAASAAAVTSNLLQLHHNFRWILCSNHTEPVSGFLQRYLRRRLIAAGTARPGARCSESGPARDADDDDAGVMSRVVDWLPRAWQQVNSFLESRCATTHLTIGTIFHQLFRLPLSELVLVLKVTD